MIGLPDAGSEDSVEPGVATVCRSSAEEEVATACVTGGAGVGGASKDTTRGSPGRAVSLDPDLQS